MIDNKLTKLVFDLSNIAYRSLYAMSLKTSKDTPSGHVFACVNTLKSLRNKYPLAEFVFVLDSKPIRKMKLYPEYKLNRKKAEFNPTKDIHKLVRLTSCSVVWCDGEEADDIIASYCEANSDSNLVIVSSDSDLYQLINKDTGVRQLNPATGEYITSDDLYKKFGLTRFDRVNLWKAIFGDSGDNVKPPIPRLIKKDLISVINSCDGTIDGFFSRVNTQIQDRTYNKITAIESLDPFKLNYEIVTLDKNVNYSEKKYFGNLLWLCQMLKQFECNSLINGELRRLV